MMKKIGNLRGLLDSWKEVSQSCDDLAELYEMSKAEESADLTATIESDIADLRARVEKMEFKKMLNGPDDACSCLMSIHPGAGGTESQDWALMLFRMYTHFFERENMEFKVVDFQEAEDAGLKSATIEVTCENAYGLLRSEIGVHRLVRISPFDANARRHNRPHQGGTGRFVTSGLSIIARNAHSWPYRIVADGDVYEGPALTLAIQNGPTYGGGFRICPDASPTDGMLDLCASLSAPLPAAQLAYFGLIRLGRHTHSQRLLLRQFTDLDVTFPEEVPPCQVDGERLEGSSFQVRVLPQALRVVRPRTTR
jgi:hypothetical protein